jgi:glutamate-1-semialdehyde 2,1-aminomutase
MSTGTQGDVPSRSVARALNAIEKRYLLGNVKSRAHYAKSVRAMPGGNSRTVLHYDPFPVTIAKGSGANLWDLDGHRYTDFLGEYSAGLYGHSHPKVRSAVVRALSAGMTFGAPNLYEGELARLITKRFPACKSVRFCNSGTEANLMAVSLARTVTGKQAILAFEGGYHGGVFQYAKGGSPMNAPFPTLIGQYNSVDPTADLIRARAGDLAAVIVEPMMGGAGCIPASPQFLQMLRKTTAAAGVLLIFDEVMTSRLGVGGLHGALRIAPDLVTFGKYLGGGLTFGAFGGHKEYMSRLDPRRSGALAHSGTFNNNILTMAAGVAAIGQVYTGPAVRTLNRTGDQLRNRLNELGARLAMPFQATGIGSLLCMHFQRGAIIRAEDVRSPAWVRKLIHLTLLGEGLYTARRGYMSISLPLTERHCRKLLDAVETFLVENRSLLEELE